MAAIPDDDVQYGLWLNDFAACRNESQLSRLGLLLAKLTKCEEFPTTLAARLRTPYAERLEELRAAEQEQQPSRWDAAIDPDLFF